MNKSVKCTREDDNPWDCHTVAVVKTTPVSTKTVGHVPQCISGLKYLYNAMYKYIVTKVRLKVYQYLINPQKT